MLPCEYHITLKDDIRPGVVPPRKVPIVLKDRIKAELDIMVRNDAIAPI